LPFIKEGPRYNIMVLRVILLSSCSVKEVAAKVWDVDSKAVIR